jgi:5-methylcytosine-specific restriction enzyme A
MSTDRAKWSDAELLAAINAYVQMLNAETNGADYNKAEINRALRARGQPLSHRTKASIEYRMQNISAVLKSEGREFVPGYAPAKNVGEGIRARIKSLLATHHPAV